MRRNHPPRCEAEEDAAAPAGGGVEGCGEQRAVVGAVSSKWAKGTGGPAGDECQNLVAALTTNPYGDHESRESHLVVGAIAAESFTGGAGGRPEGAAAGHFVPVVTGTLIGSLGYSGPDENDAARGMYIAHTLRGDGFDASEDGTGRGTPLVAFHGSQDPNVSGDVTHPVGRNQGQETCIAFTQNQDGDVLTGDVSPALGTNSNATGRNTAKVLYYGVRRLTPNECERLQGLPDDYTLIPFRGKPAADGNRYRAIGNGMAVPCVRWILTRIHDSLIHRTNLC